MPRLRKARSSSFELDSSSGGSRCGSISTMVTSAPNDRQTLANSTPITPPPRITAEAGTRSRVSAWSLVITRSPSICRPGSDRGSRAGRQHDMRALVHHVADGDRGRRHQPAVAVDDLDLAAGQRALQALPEPVDDLVLVAVDGGHVDAVEGGPHADGGGVPGVVGDLGRVQQRLGRDAAPVQARAADLVLLDQHHSLTELGRPQRAGIPAAAAAQDDDVVAAGIGLGHQTLLVTSAAVGLICQVIVLARAARPPRPARSGPGYELPTPVPPLGV